MNMRPWIIGACLVVVLATGCSWDALSPTPLPEVKGVGFRSDTGFGAGAVLVGAGDIGLCGSRAAEATARLLDGIEGIVFTTGDNAYPIGSAANFRDCYEPNWGRHKARTRPTPGNHEYESPGAAPYFEYFGANAGPAGLGYYTYRAGEWKVYAVNSNLPLDAASPQVQWLRAELTLDPSACALVTMHHPRFNSGPHGDNPGVDPLWRVLYEAGVEIIVAGHEHYYERFAPQDPDGVLDPVRGIRQFIVGTGGAELRSPVRLHANSDVVWSRYGVLQLTLRADGYSWQFVSETGAPADVGSALCH